MKPKATISLAIESALVVLTLGALVRDIRKHGPLSLQVPDTVFSNAEPAQRAMVPYLRFLDELRPRLPSDVRISILNCDRAVDSALAYDVAVGQLPHQTVLGVFSGRERGSTSGLPAFTAIYGCAPLDASWRQVALLPRGALFQRSSK